MNHIKLQEAEAASLYKSKVLVKNQVISHIVQQSYRPRHADRNLSKD